MKLEDLFNSRIEVVKEAQGYSNFVHDVTVKVGEGGYRDEIPTDEFEPFHPYEEDVKVDVEFNYYLPQQRAADDLPEVEITSVVRQDNMKNIITLLSDDKMEDLVVAALDQI